MDDAPLVSIGMPIYNARAELRDALDSLCGQTFRNFELIISDNASDDGSDEICRAYASADSRIKYIRQEVNIGAVRNFEFVLRRARSRYFMWAAADDVRSADFLELNCSFLDNNPDYICSTSPVRFEGAQFDPVKMGDASLTENAVERALKFLRSWHANGRFYSVMRTEPLQACPYLECDFFGADWAVMLYLIMRGKTNRHVQGSMVLGRGGISNSGNIFRIYRKSWVHWFAPLLELSHTVTRLFKLEPGSSSVRLLLPLARLNLQAAYMSTRAEVRPFFRFIRSGKKNETA